MPAAAAFFQPINGPMMVRAPAPAAYETSKLIKLIS